MTYFQSSFTDALQPLLCSESIVHSSLKTPSHHRRVATLPCEIHRVSR